MPFGNPDGFKRPLSRFAIGIHRHQRDGAHSLAFLSCSETQDANPTRCNHYPHPPDTSPIQLQDIGAVSG